MQSTRGFDETLASSLLVSLAVQIDYTGGFPTGSALAVLILLLTLYLQVGEGRGEWKGWVEEAWGTANRRAAPGIHTDAASPMDGRGQAQ